MNRLDRETVNAGLSGATEDRYFYDRAGNRLRKETWRDDAATTSAIDLILDSATDYGYDANDRLTSETTGSNVTTYGYDANGSQIRRTLNAADQVFYRWDADHRLVSVDFDDDADAIIDRQVQYEYNSSGLRTSRTENGTTTSSLLDTSLAYSQVALEYAPATGSASAITARFLFGSSLISQERFAVGTASEAAYYLQDFHSGVRQLADETGTITDAYAYDAFGAIASSSGETPNDHLYRSEVFDPTTRVIDLRQRPYLPESGRFPTADPFLGYRTLPASLHRYSYAYNDPINLGDPSGENAAFATLGRFYALSLANALQALATANASIVTFAKAGFLIGGASLGTVALYNLLGQQYVYSSGNAELDELAKEVAEHGLDTLAGAGVAGGAAGTNEAVREITGTTVEESLRFFEDLVAGTGGVLIVDEAEKKIAETAQKEYITWRSAGTKADPSGIKPPTIDVNLNNTIGKYFKIKLKP